MFKKLKSNYFALYYECVEFLALVIIVMTPFILIEYWTDQPIYWFRHFFWSSAGVLCGKLLNRYL